LDQKSKMTAKYNIHVGHYGGDILKIILI
jgi:hypothetical protein